MVLYVYFLKINKIDFNDLLVEKLRSLSSKNFFTPPGTIFYDKKFLLENKSTNMMMKLKINAKQIQIDCYRIVKSTENDEEEEEEDIQANEKEEIDEKHPCKNPKKRNGKWKTGKNSSEKTANV